MRFSAETGVEEWIAHRNSTKPQETFVRALCRMGEYHSELRLPCVLYGGAGYGGKSYGIRTAAVAMQLALAQSGVQCPQGMVCCRRYTELTDRLVEKFQVEFGGIGEVFNRRQSGLVFEFKDKRLGRIKFRNLDNPSKYRGSEACWVLVDELTENPMETAEHLMYVLRGGARPDGSPPPFYSFGAGSNPDGPGHAWVKQAWIKKDKSGLPPGLRERDFLFIPARAYDNPTFTESVKASLTGFTDKTLVSARWEGSWDLEWGARFGQFDRRVHMFNWRDFERCFGDMAAYSQILRATNIKIFASLDFGTDGGPTSGSVLLFHAVDPARRIWTFGEKVMRGLTLNQQADVILEQCDRWGPAALYVDPSLHAHDSDGIDRVSKLRHKIRTPIVDGINNRIEGWATLEHMLSWAGVEKDGWLSIESPPLWRVHEDCGSLAKFLESAPRDEVRTEDVCRHYKDDHAGDAARYFLHSHMHVREGRLKIPMSALMTPGR